MELKDTAPTALSVVTVRCGQVPVRRRYPVSHVPSPPTMRSSNAKTVADVLSDSTVTIFLIGAQSAETLGWKEQKFIKRELQASLYNSEGNTRNGILGVVLPSMYDSIYKGQHICSICGKSHNTVAINDATTIKEFSKNYYLNNHGKCAYDEDDRFCILVKWDDFKCNPNAYIEQAFNKRNHPIASEVIVRPK